MAAMEAPSNNTSNLLHLPSDAVTEILCRLPIKTLGAARCVCKSWLNLVSGDTDFARLHRQRSATTKLLLRTAVNTRRASATFYSGNLPRFDSDSVYEIKPKFLFNLPRFDIKRHNTIKRKHDFRFANSCNGLLCFHGFDLGFALILNPITTEFITVPMRKKRSSKIIPTVNYRLGFSEKENRFKLLRVKCSANSPKPFACIFTFEKGSNWRNVRDCPYPIRHNVRSESVILDHKLHYDFVSSDSTVNGIACFDFEEERFRVVPIPSSQHFSASNSLFGVFWGYLSLCHRPPGSIGYEIWAMKEYGIEDSWGKLFSLPYVRLLPHKELESGEILIFWKSKYMPLYNPSTNKISYMRHGFQFSQVSAYSPTLIRLEDALAGYEARIQNVNSRSRQKSRLRLFYAQKVEQEAQNMV